MAKKDEKWLDVTVPAGATESAEFAIPRDEVVAPPGRVTDADGDKADIKKQDYDVADAQEGVSSKIVLTEAAPTALVFKVRAAYGDDDDDDDDGEPVAGQLPA